MLPGMSGVAASAPSTWAPTGSMSTARFGHTATLLPNGTVLVAGGERCDSSSCDYLSSAELYDPGTGTWTPTGSMRMARQDHTATLLRDGKVLVASGYTYATSSGAHWCHTSPRMPRKGSTALAMTFGRLSSSPT
jgi:hypothetical protein